MKAGFVAVVGAAIGVLSCGCAERARAVRMGERPRVAPTTQPAGSGMILESPDIRPMHRDILAVDLPAALRIACAENLDIRRARQQVEASRGEWERSIGGALPGVVPSAAFEHIEGTVRAVQGNLVGATFNTFQPAVAVQWITSPGQVLYELIASRKRLYATEHQEQAVRIESLRQTAVQFYDLVLAQTRVSTARQAVAEAEELLRISRLRTRTGTGVLADELRADARLAERQQDLVAAVNGFYESSVALSLTLHLDASVTLVPSLRELPRQVLVRGDLSLDELLEIAIASRPDLRGVRSLVEVAAARRGATWWGSLGPQFTVGYQLSGITGHANNVIPGQGLPGNLILNPLSQNGSFSSNPLTNGLIREGIARGTAGLARRRDETAGLSNQHRYTANVGWRFSWSIFGDLRSARAAEEQAIIEAERQLDLVRGQVVLASQAGKAHSELAQLAEHQVASAQEALRLTQANLQAGTMTTLDVLQSQDAVNQARLRLAEAVVRHNQAQINLLAALGLLAEEEAPSAL